MKKINFNRKLRRKIRISSNIFGSKDKPRVVVYRSNRYIYAQAIDDEARKTIVAFSSLNLKTDKKEKKSQEAKLVGLKMAELLKEKNITQGVFDRSLYGYLGRVKSLCEGIREGGIKI